VTPLWPGRVPLRSLPLLTVSSSIATHPAVLFLVGKPFEPRTASAAPSGGRASVGGRANPFLTECVLSGVYPSATALPVVRREPVS
jgi:hypothetical protein